MAAKVFDGLFLGDAETSMDADFLDLNKISRLVNLAGRHIRNALSGHGFVYKTYYWEDDSDFLVFPAMEKDKALLDMVSFIDISLRRGLSVLIFSERGMSRCAFGVCAFLMFKYHWGFEKSYDFIVSKKRDVQFNQGFIQQLFTLEKRLIAKRKREMIPIDSLPDSEMLMRERLRTREWDASYLDRKNTAVSKGAKSKKEKNIVKRTDELSDDEVEDELLLINSYLNSKSILAELPVPNRNVYDCPKDFTLRFNSILLEEDVHVFPTSPPSRYNPPKLPRGILKGGEHAVSIAESQSKNSSWDSSEDDVEEKAVSKAATPLPHIPSTPGHTTVPRPLTSDHAQNQNKNQNHLFSAATRDVIITDKGENSSDVEKVYSSSGSQDLDVSKEAVQRKLIRPSSARPSRVAEVLTERDVTHWTSGGVRGGSSTYEDRRVSSSGGSNGHINVQINGNSNEGSNPKSSSSSKNTGDFNTQTGSASNHQNGGTLSSGQRNGHTNGEQQRNALTAEDCMRNILHDLKTSQNDEKTYRPSSNNIINNNNINTNNSSNNNNSSSSRGYKDGDSPSKEQRITSTASVPFKVTARGADAKDPYEDLGALSLHDLAALPLHFEDNKGVFRKERKQDVHTEYDQAHRSHARDRISYRDHYVNTPEEFVNAHDRDRDKGRGARNQTVTTNKQSSSTVGQREREKERERERDSQRERERERENNMEMEMERMYDPLAAFHRRGQEGAVRVQYNSMNFPVAAPPTRVVQRAWQEDNSRNERSSDRNKSPSQAQTQTQAQAQSLLQSQSKQRASPSRNGHSNGTSQSAEFKSSSRSVLPAERREDRERDREKEREREREREKPVKTYRRGSPAPSRVSTPRVPSHVLPSPTSSTPQRSRASSPSLVNRSRGSSPGPSPEPTLNGRSGRDATSGARGQQMRQSSDVSDRRLSASLDQSQDSGYPYLHSNNSSVNGRSNGSGSGGGSKGTRPATPGTVRGKVPIDFTGSHQVNSSSRSSTPTRGNWR